MYVCVSLLLDDVMFKWESLLHPRTQFVSPTLQNADTEIDIDASSSSGQRVHHKYAHEAGSLRLTGELLGGFGVLVLHGCAREDVKIQTPLIEGRGVTETTEVCDELACGFFKGNAVLGRGFGGVGGGGGRACWCGCGVCLFADG